MDLEAFDNQPEIILGAEHDRDLFDALSKTLKSIGANSISKDWAVGGSQEISTWVVEIDGQIINVKAETYIGLSICGTSDLIEKIAQQVKQQKAC